MFCRGQVLYLAFQVASILNFEMQAMMTTPFYHVHQKVLRGRLLNKKGYGSIAHEAKPNGLLIRSGRRALEGEGSNIIVLVSPN